MKIIPIVHSVSFLQKEGILYPAGSPVHCVRLSHSVGRAFATSM